MNRETLIWLLVFILGAAGLGVTAAVRPHGMGVVYARQVATPLSDGASVEMEQRLSALEYSANPQGAYVSTVRTVGVWTAALLTLFAFSFLIKDNPFYKVAEALFVGTSAAYVMVQAFWDEIITNMFAKLAPAFTNSLHITNIDTSKVDADYLPLVPMFLGVLLLWSAMPMGKWVARYPLALIVGTMAGMRMMAFLQGDFLSQIQNAIVPLIVMSGTSPARSVDWWGTVSNILSTVGLISALVFFFFSVEHKGAVGRVARVGVWLLMISFGAAFAYTVMGRIALFNGRLQFLMNDWLWLIDPAGVRPPGW